MRQYWFLYSFFAIVNKLGLFSSTKYMLEAGYNRIADVTGMASEQ